MTNFVISFTSWTFFRFKVCAGKYLGSRYGGREEGIFHFTEGGKEYKRVQEEYTQSWYRPNYKSDRVKIRS